MASQFQLGNLITLHVFLIGITGIPVVTSSFSSTTGSPRDKDTSHHLTAHQIQEGKFLKEFSKITLSLPRNDILFNFDIVGNMCSIQWIFWRFHPFLL